MGQGTSRLNWVCSCEDGKFNLTATYEEQKFSPTDTPGEEHEEKKKSQTKNNHEKSENIPTAKDTLLPIMDVETSIDDSTKGTKLRRTYSSCDLVYTKPAPDSKRVQGGHCGRSSGSNNKNSHQYRSHEVLSSAGNSSTNTESSGLSQSNSENSLNSTKSVDAKLHRMLGTSNPQRTKREQNDHLNKQKSNNNAYTTQIPTPERKLSINSSTSTGSTDRKSSIGDISSLGELLKKKKKEARRAEIVAAVTKRLYNARKKVDVKPEPVEVVPEQEDKPENEDDELEELKLCSRARTRLQELSKRALFAHRVKMKRFSDVESQTDFDKHVQRVKEVAVSTDESYHPPSMLFLDNRNFLLTNCAYPSMRQPSPWSTVSVRNHNSLPYEDNFSDDSLDSNHELDVAEEKPSLWDVISMSSGKQFKINGNDEDDQIPKNISTQTVISSSDLMRKVSILGNEGDNINVCINGTDVSEQENDCEHREREIDNSDITSDREETQQPINFCNCRESLQNDSCSKAEGPSLHKIDRHLYTITENSELSDCNDLSSCEFENSYILNCKMNKKPVIVIEKSENFPNIQETNSCKFAENDKSCQTFIGDISMSLFNETSPSNLALCDADISCRNYNPESHQHKDNIIQTIIKKKSDSVLNTDSKITDAESQFYQNIGIPNESYSEMCNKCGKFQAGTQRPVRDVKNIQTKSVQCALNNIPSNVSTQTNNTHFPNLSILCSTLLGAYHKLLQLSNPSLQSEDCIGIFFNGQSSQPKIMKSVHWGRVQEHDTVATQTDQEAEHRSTEDHSLDMGIEDDSKRGSKRKLKTRHKSLSQSDSEQSTSHQVVARRPHPKDLQTGHQRKTGENSCTTDTWETENFSDEDDAPSLPRSTVGSRHRTEASGYQHWTEIKNLILGTDRNLFPYNITADDKSSPVQHPKNVKKKSVSWPDISGCGELQTEMVFTSDHNLFDSSQASQSKITKSSLMEIIAKEPMRSSHQRKVTSHLDDCRTQSRKIHRRWSLADTNELSSIQTEGKLQLSTFLKEASALVSSLSQATRLLEKGHQLNIRSSQPESIHNELWFSDESSYFNHYPSFETQISYYSPMSLPVIKSSGDYDHERPRFRKNTLRHHRNYLRKFKDCNINTQMRLYNTQSKRGKSSRLCEHGMSKIDSLSDCSMLGVNTWCSWCNIFGCPIHHSIPDLTTILDNENSLVKSDSLYSSYLLSSPRAYRQHLVAIRRQIIKASLPITPTE